MIHALTAIWALICRFHGHKWSVKRHGKVAVSKTCARCGTVRSIKHRTKKEQS